MFILMPMLTACYTVPKRLFHLSFSCSCLIFLTEEVNPDCETRLVHGMAGWDQGHTQENEVCKKKNKEGGGLRVVSL